MNDTLYKMTVLEDCNSEVIIKLLILTSKNKFFYFFFFRFMNTEPKI